MLLEPPIDELVNKMLKARVNERCQNILEVEMMLTSVLGIAIGLLFGLFCFGVHGRVGKAENLRFFNIPMLLPVFQR